MTAVAQISPGRARRAATERIEIALHGLRGVLVVLVIVAAAAMATSPLVAVFMGYQPDVVHAGTLSPGLRSGDVVFSQAVTASEVRAGDVVTLADPSRPGQTRTVRVLTSVPFGDHVAFTVAGTAGAASAPFAVGGGAHVARVAFQVPGPARAGHLVADASTPVLLVVAGALGVGLGQRRRTSRRSRSLHART